MEILITDRNREFYQQWFLLIMLVLPVIMIGMACSSPMARPEIKPNIIIIFTDDMGFADVRVYGAEGFKTPNIDRMSGEGMRITSFYVPASVFTPSRTVLLPGRVV